MSRKATNEYIGIKRRAYAQAGRAKRMRILDDVCERTGCERKYANRLLTGSRNWMLSHLLISLLISLAIGIGIGNTSTLATFSSPLSREG